MRQKATFRKIHFGRAVSKKDGVESTGFMARREFGALWPSQAHSENEDGFRQRRESSNRSSLNHCAISD